MFTLVMGVIVAGLRPIYASPLKIDSCSLIEIVIVAGLLWTRSASINISSAITRVKLSGKTWPTSTTSAIPWCIMAGLLRPKSTNFMTSAITWGILSGIKIPIFTTFLSQIHFNTFFFRNFIIVVTTTGGIMAGLTIRVSYTSITPHR